MLILNGTVENQVDIYIVFDCRGSKLWCVKLYLFHLLTAIYTDCFPWK